MRKIFIIEGTTGEYSDRSNWIVEAYADENAAKTQTEKLNRLVKEAEGTKESYYGAQFTNAFKKLQELDPCAAIDYTGTDYTVFETLLKEMP